MLLPAGPGLCGLRVVRKEVALSTKRAQQLLDAIRKQFASLFLQATLFETLRSLHRDAGQQTIGLGSPPREQH